MKTLPIVLLALASAAATASAQGWQNARPRTYPYNIPTPLADDPSPFVNVPARLGFTTGVILGLGPGLLIGGPPAIIERIATGSVSQFSVDLVQVPAVYGGVAMQYAAGAPFFLAKAVFWDIPGRLLGRGPRR